ncbi:DUF3310 domain-containing protein [candidate division KSB1 bacterium]|nr:DUF3310 domain-containing protein [candidate division KSB1 bacterium]
MENSDQINPSHYSRLNPQPYEVIKAWELNYFLGSAIKYIARAGHKEGASEETDLKKAIRHIELYLDAR